MKILHFADFHLGADMYGPLDPETRIPIRVLDYMDIFDSMIEFAVVEGVDLTLFAGDAFHKPNPNPTYLGLFAERIMRLSDFCKVVLLVGNHDMQSVSKASAIDIFQTMKLQEVIVGREFELHEICTNAGTVQVATAPYPLKVGRDEFVKRLQDLADDVDTELSSILLGHFAISGSKISAGTDITLQESTEASLEDVIYPWDYVAMGHIHLHQNMTEGMEEAPPVVYSGSLERVDFGERDEVKGFCLIDLDSDGMLDWEFVEVDARPFVHIVSDVIGAKRPERQIEKDLKEADVLDAVVKVTVLADFHTLSAQEISSILYDGGAFNVRAVGYKIPPQQSDREVSDQFMALDEVGKLEEFLITADVEDERIDTLLDLAEEVMDEVDYGKE